MGNKNFRYATVLALTTAFISGFANFTNKIAVTGIKNPIFFTTLKNSIVAIFLIGLLVLIKKWPEVKALTKNQWIKLFLIGSVGGSLPFALFFTGLSKTAAINAALIHKTLFLWVAFLAIPFLKEKIGRWQWAAIIAIFSANLLVGGFSEFKYNSGELMVLFATLLWAVENIIAKKTLKDLSSSVVASARMTIGSIILIAFLYFKNGTIVIPNLNSTQWGWIFLTGALLFGYVITWYEALKFAPATYVATLLVPATLVTNVLSALFITHSFGVRDLISSLLFIIGTSIMVIFAKRMIEKTLTKPQERLTSI